LVHPFISFDKKDVSVFQDILFTTANIGVFEDVQCIVDESFLLQKISKRSQMVLRFRACSIQFYTRVVEDFPCKFIEIFAHRIISNKAPDVTTLQDVLFTIANT